MFTMLSNSVSEILITHVGSSPVAPILLQLRRPRRLPWSSLDIGHGTIHFYKTMSKVLQQRANISISASNAKEGRVTRDAFRTPRRSHLLSAFVAISRQKSSIRITLRRHVPFCHSCDSGKIQGSWRLVWTLPQDLGPSLVVL